VGELRDQHKLRELIKRLLKEFAGQGERNKDGVQQALNQTDPDSALMSINGFHASYNVQAVVDDKNGLIVHADVVCDIKDNRSFIGASSAGRIGSGKNLCSCMCRCGLFDHQ